VKKPDMAARCHYRVVMDEFREQAALPVAAVSSYTVAK